jgi:hypothetical protein
MKVELDVNHKIDSVDLVDQLVMARLAEIQKNLNDWDDAREVQAACQTILDWMSPDIGE